LPLTTAARFFVVQHNNAGLGATKKLVRQGRLDGPEQASNVLLLVKVQMLVMKNQHGMGGEGLANGARDGVRDRLSQIHAIDARPRSSL